MTTHETPYWKRHPLDASTVDDFEATWRRMHQGEDGSLFLYAWSRDARRASVARWRGDEWVPWGELSQPLPIDAALPVQDLRLGDDALWLLDGAGALWRGVTSWERVAAPDGGPGRSEQSDRRMAWERGRGRLVVHGGVVENATWCFDPREERWRELLSHPRPRHGGGGALVSTPSALLLFVFDELWRLDGDRWVCVATLERHVEARDASRGAPARDHWLMWAAARDAWLTFVPERSAQPFALRTADGWERLDIALPEELVGPFPWELDDGDERRGDADVLIGLDAETEALVVRDRASTFTFDLAGLAWPRGGLSLAEVPRRNGILPAPTHHNALALRVTHEEAPLTDEEWALLPEALRPPFEHEHLPRVIAPLPRGFVSEGLPPALVIGKTLSGAPTDLDSLVAPDERSENVVVAPLATWTRGDEGVSFDVHWDMAGARWKVRARRISLEPFVDLCAQDTLRYDSPPRRAIHLREENKIGGDAAVSVRDAPTDPVTLQLRELCPVGDNDRLAIWVFVEDPAAVPPWLCGVSRVL